MTNISKQKREQFISVLKELKLKNNDEDNLKLINDLENFLIEKKYGLVWEEHKEKVDEILEENVPVFVEKKDSSIISTNSDINFLLEGDNLHSLYLLEKTHKESIDLIYIDPPYNTGNKDFKYDDNFISKDDGFKHSKWISFINNRLRIARNLLKKNGIIAISIDENEYAPLKLLCDEIFGEQNHLSTHHLQVRYENKSLNEDNDWQPIMEYVLIYEKVKGQFKANKPHKPYDLSKFKYKINELSSGEVIEVGGRKVTIFKNNEWEIEEVEGQINGLKETWASGSLVRQSGTAAEFLEKHLIQRKDKDGLNVLYKVDGMGKDGDGLGYRYITGPKKANATRGKFYTGVPIERKIELKKGVSNKTKPITNYIDLSGDFGNIRHEGKVPFNNGKKPIKLIKEIINYHSNKDAIILDFFAGSGSTGHAVLDLNKIDNGNRKFILCTNNENNICYDVTLKRMNNISEHYKYSLKHFKTDILSKNVKEDSYLSHKLMERIKELVELEYHVDLNESKFKLVFDEEEISNLLSEKKNIIKIFKPSYVLLSTKELNYISKNKIEVVNIPDYYYLSELREVGEI